MADLQQQEQLIAGFIKGTHGLLGNVKLESASGVYEHLLGLKEVTLRQGQVQTVYKVQDCKMGAGCLLLKLFGVDSVQEANLLKGACLMLPRQKCCHLKKDEWYIGDIEGCILFYAVNDKTKSQVVGQVTGVLEGGVSDLLEVRIFEGCELLSDKAKFDKSGKQRVALVPFSSRFIGKVDVAKKQMQLMHLWIVE